MLTIPSPVQGVLAKEEGTTCHLKWSASPEKGIQGYRVYRMDGRFDKEPVTRLTPEPITGLTFSDKDAGKKSRRYYVVAVDALGFVLTGTACLGALFLKFGVKPARAIVIAVVATLVIHTLFYKLLRVPLPWGVLERFAW